jgi:hydroxyacylglutathione hydrolase
MTPEEVRAAQQEGAVILDMRTPHPFASEHIEDAVSFQFNRADLVDRAEMVFPEDLPMVMHGEPQAIGRMAAKLMAEGGFNVLGHLEGGLAAWKDAGFPVETMPTLDVDELESKLGEVTVVDARDPFEFKYGHVPGSVILPWTEAWLEAPAMDAPPPLVVICGDEIRSVLVASILKRDGKDADLVVGGMVDWLDRGYPLEKGMG